MAYFLRNLEPTEAGKRLQLDEETIKNTMLVYRLKDDKWLYHGPYSEKRELEEDDIVVPVTSSYDRTEPIAQGRVFANVLGSSHDRVIDDFARSWIELVFKGIVEYETVVKMWQPPYLKEDDARMEAIDIAARQINSCCMEACLYRDDGANKACRIAGIDYANYPYISYPIQCNVNMPNQIGQIVGGHVTEGRVNQKITIPNQSVALMPICQNHNIMRWTIKGEYGVTGGRFYMKTQRPTYAIILQNYIPSMRIKEHMSNHAVEKI